MKSKRQVGDNEAPIAVPCPLWVQKRIRKNLMLAARTKIGLSRCKRAFEILAAIRKQARKRTSSPAPVAQIANATKPTAEVVKHIREAPGTQALRRNISIIGMFRKYASFIVKFGFKLRARIGRLVSRLFHSGQARRQKRLTYNTR